MKRRAKMIVVLLALGAIVNIAVAWGLAWWVVPEKEYDTPYDGLASFHVDVFAFGDQHRQVWFTGRRSFGATAYWIFRVRTEAEPEPFSISGARRDLRADGFRLLPGWVSPTWLAPHEASEMQSFGDYAMVIRGFGTPMRSMATAMVIDYQGNISNPVSLRRVLDGIRVVDRTGDVPYEWRGEDRIRTLPLRPVWFGFFFNTLFYALLLWLLFAAPGTARRALRRRSRLCEKCAYPIGVSPVCTECGAVVACRTVE